MTFDPECDRSSPLDQPASQKREKKPMDHSSGNHVDNLRFTFISKLFVEAYLVQMGE